jgi:hypothetical protein
MLYLFGDFIGISTDPLYLFVVLLAVIEIALVLASLTSFKKISEILHRPKIWHNVRNGAYSQVACYASVLLSLVPAKATVNDIISFIGLRYPGAVFATPGAVKQDQQDLGTLSTSFTCRSPDSIALRLGSFGVCIFHGKIL